MLTTGRNRIQDGNWALEKLEEQDFAQIGVFDCDNDDLNEFFKTDALEHKKELLTETYSLYEATVGEKKSPVALVSFCNDVIHLSKEKRSELLDPKKALYQYLPAVKIARLGVHKPFQGKNLGTFLVNLTKKLFLTDNRTGCRFITVDALNDKRGKKFYQKNGFEFLHSKDKNKKTRIMWFDLKRLILNTSKIKDNDAANIS